MFNMRKLCEPLTSSLPICPSCTAEMFLLLSGFPLFLSRFLLNPSCSWRGVSTDSIATSEASVDGVTEADPPPTLDTGLVLTDSPSLGDRGVVDWELALIVDGGFDLEFPPCEDMLDLDSPACEDKEVPVLETFPWLVGVLGLEPPRFAPASSSLRWQEKDKRDG